MSLKPITEMRQRVKIEIERHARYQAEKIGKIINSDRWGIVDFDKANALHEAFLEWAGPPIEEISAEDLRRAAEETVTRFKSAI